MIVSTNQTTHPNYPNYFKMPESVHDSEKAAAAIPQQPEMEYPDSKRRALIMLSVYLSIFLVTLVRLPRTSKIAQKSNQAFLR